MGFVGLFSEEYNDWNEQAEFAIVVLLERIEYPMAC